ncbi:MAG: guanylate kinase [Mycoplasmataceae bacterium]|nr:guanylate kinase [Mycoplasmataceae bacterium]
MKRGLLIVFSGPSGVGKKTVWYPLLKHKSLNLVFSISMTTRKKRFNEVNKKDYYFVTKAAFKQAVKQGKMLEYATYINNYYGTPKAFVEQLRDQGKNVLLEIEPKGAMQIMAYAKKQHDQGVITIFISPPSLIALEKRLLKRGTEPIQTIRHRIKQAKWEMSLQDKYDYVIINDYINKARKHLVTIIKKEISHNA